jgi:type I restriction enzyme S subunit
VFRGILVDNQFLAHYLNVFDYKGRVAGATRSKLNQSKALDIPVPLPPLEEQKRITVKVDGLLTICDGLEIALREGSAKRSQLLAAVIHEVLH